MNLTVFALILITGIITSLSDLKFHRIKNNHLLIVFSSTLLLYIFLSLFKSPFGAAGLKIMAANILLAVLIGFSFFFTGRWAGGDAKLFMLYSFIISINPNAGLLKFPCLVLFINTFLLSAMVLFPLQLIRNSGYILASFAKKKFYSRFFRTFGITFSLVWILYLLIRVIPLNNSLFITFFLTYLFYAFFGKYFFNASLWFFSGLIVSGLLLRILLEPSSVTLDNFFMTFKRTFIYSSAFYVLDILTYDKRENTRLTDRVPFAPFMFAGALLSETDFLTRAMSLFLSLQKL